MPWPSGRTATCEMLREPVLSVSELAWIGVCICVPRGVGHHRCLKSPRPPAGLV